jgi:hypothetical protein
MELLILIKKPIDIRQININFKTLKKCKVPYIFFILIMITHYAHYFIKTKLNTF